MQHFLFLFNVTLWTKITKTNQKQQIKWQKQQNCLHLIILVKTEKLNIIQIINKKI